MEPVIEVTRRARALSRKGDGQVIEAVGDLAMARTIIVYVPGPGQSLRSFDSSARGGGAEVGE